MISIIESSGSHEAQGQGIGSRPNVNEALKEVDILLGDGTPPPPPPGEYPEWQLGAQYQVGDRVSFEDINYQCLQNHTAHSQTWNPRSAQSLWRPLKMGVFN